MSENELKTANRPQALVEYRGPHEYLRSLGRVTALIYRCEDGLETLTVEITSHSTSRSRMICRPDEVYPFLSEVKQ